MTGPGESNRTRHLFGCTVDAMSSVEVVDLCEQAIQERRTLTIGVVNAAKLVKMRTDASLRDAVTASDIVLADGQAVVWASHVLRQPLPERVAGIDLFLVLLGLAEKQGHRVFLLGATQQVLDAAARRIRSDHPRLRIVGTHHGYYDEGEGAHVATVIRDAQPDLLFVAMTSPRKEKFLAKWSDFMNVPVCHGVGGSLDVLAGVTRRAPVRWQRLGLEWLFRMLQEPRRLGPRYLVTNTAFLLMLGKELRRRHVHPIE